MRSCLIPMQRFFMRGCLTHVCNFLMGCLVLVHHSFLGCLTQSFIQLYHTYPPCLPLQEFEYSSLK